jgi:hypothetical protein
MFKMQMSKIKPSLARRLPLPGLVTAEDSTNGL